MHIQNINVRSLDLTALLGFTFNAFKSTTYEDVTVHRKVASGAILASVPRTIDGFALFHPNKNIEPMFFGVDRLNEMGDSYGNHMRVSMMKSDGTPIENAVDVGVVDSQEYVVSNVRTSCDMSDQLIPEKHVRLAVTARKKGLENEIVIKPDDEICFILDICRVSPKGVVLQAEQMQLGAYTSGFQVAVNDPE